MLPESAAAVGSSSLTDLIYAAHLSEEPWRIDVCGTTGCHLSLTLNVLVLSKATFCQIFFYTNHILSCIKITIFIFEYFKNILSSVGNENKSRIMIFPITIIGIRE